MNPGQDFVGQNSDSITRISNSGDQADLSASVWSSMQAERERGSTTQTAPNRVADPSRTNQFNPSEAPNRPGADSRSSSEGPNYRGEPTNQQLMDRFNEQNRNLTNELFGAPLRRELTPAFHAGSEQLIRDADNLPHDRIEQDIQRQREQARDIQIRIGGEDSGIYRRASASPELERLVPALMRNIDSARWGHDSSSRENLQRLDEIAPGFREILENRRELGRELKEAQQGISDLGELHDMPMSARFDYASQLVAAGGADAQKAVRYLTEMLIARPEMLNYRASGPHGDRTMTDLILGSGALNAKGFLRALGQAGGNADDLWREYNRRNAQQR
jgi:hypothetical protein